jgi:hypothetical protein
LSTTMLWDVAFGHGCEFRYRILVFWSRVAG